MEYPKSVNAFCDCCRTNSVFAYLGNMEDNDGTTIPLYNCQAVIPNMNRECGATKSSGYLKMNGNGQKTFGERHAEELFTRFNRFSVQR